MYLKVYIISQIFAVITKYGQAAKLLRSKLLLTPTADFPHVISLPVPSSPTKRPSLSPSFTLSCLAQMTSDVLAHLLAQSISHHSSSFVDRYLYSKLRHFSLN